MTQTTEDQLRAEVERLHERLEDIYVWDANGRCVQFEPGEIPDGIECRDETIRWQDQSILNLRAEIERLQHHIDYLNQTTTPRRVYLADCGGWLSPAVSAPCSCM